MEQRIIQASPETSKFPGERAPVHASLKREGGVVLNKEGLNHKTLKVVETNTSSWKGLQTKRQ